MRSIDPRRGQRNHCELERLPRGTRPAVPNTVGAAVVRASAPEPLFGDRVGPYQVIRRVAPGCYDAEAIASGDAVRLDLAGEADSALIDVRFSRARTQLELVDHPGVAQLIDQGVLSNGRPWVASQRPPGTSLSSILARRRLEPRETVALIYSVAGVLALAHHRQIVHGSLRPHHLTLARGAKVSISGWAWLRTSGLPAFGDPASRSVFNPPEHDGQGPIDGRADVYALGAIAYRALTGVYPDVSRDLLDARTALGRVIERMLASDPRDRATAAALLAELHDQRQRPSDRMSSPTMADLAAAEEATERSPAIDRHDPQAQDRSHPFDHGRRQRRARQSSRTMASCRPDCTTCMSKPARWRKASRSAPSSNADASS